MALFFANSGFALASTSESADFKFEFDSMDVSFDALYSDDFYIDGGMLSIERIGSSPDFKVEPSVVRDDTCGNGVKESGELCDGSDFGTLTCSSYGFDTGTLSCNSTCSVVDFSACYDTTSGGGGSSSSPEGNTHWPVNDEEEDQTEEETTNNQTDETVDNTQTEENVLPEEEATEEEQQQEENQQEQEYEHQQPDWIILEPQEKQENKNNNKTQPQKATEEENQEHNVAPELTPEQEQAQEEGTKLKCFDPYEFHLEVFDQLTEINSLDQTPLLAGELAKNQEYEMDIYDQHRKIIEQAIIKTNQDGYFVYETKTQLDIGRYQYVFYNENDQIVRRYLINVEQETEKDQVIDLGLIEKWPFENELSVPQKRMFIYIVNTDGLVVEVIKQKADQHGLVQIELPKNLQAGKYTMYLINLTDAGREKYKIEKDKTYLFEINDNYWHAVAEEENGYHIFTVLFFAWLLLFGLVYRLTNNKNKN